MKLKRYDYQPGNGARYDIMYGHNLDTGGALLVWLSRGGSGGSAFRFNSNGSGGYIAAGYLMEKMNIALRGDALALCAFLNERGHRAETGGGFDGFGKYIKEVSNG
jgi:hypothetical protein